MAKRRRSGDGEDYPSLTASRLRLRRMLCFLRHHGLTASARELERETAVFFDAAYMEHLMTMGVWDKADGYLQRFLPAAEDRSPQSLCLVIHLRSAWTLAVVAAGGPTAAEFASTFDELNGPCASNFRNVLHKMHADQTRASMLWKKVAPSAVNLALDMLAECPELKGKMHLPRDRPMPWEVAPLTGALGSRRRRGKAADRAPATVVTRAFERRKRSLLVQETNAYSGVPSDASSSSAVLNTNTEQIAPKPIILGEQAMENVETAPEQQDAARLKQSHDRCMP